MANFALLDQQNTVLQTVAVNNSDINDLPFPESEPVGIAYLQGIFGADTIWKQTSFSGSFRQRPASIGGYYNADHDYFVDPSPYPSWILNVSDGSWQPPIPKPTAPDGYIAVWLESKVNWYIVLAGNN